MTNHHISQSQKRHSDSLGSLFRPENHHEALVSFLKSSSDVGVERNGGRNGSRLGPQSFLSYFKRLTIKNSLASLTFWETELAEPNEEKADFPQAQLQQASRISAVLKQIPKAFICHLGGGHDHVYPLLMALSERYKKIIVINIDAHADTRTDAAPHSGTPFRQFDEMKKAEFHLYQFGLLEFANSSTTLGQLKNGQMTVVWRHQLKEAPALARLFEKIKSQINAETAVVFSLDADALNGAEVPGVSAVNPQGLSRSELSEIWSLYKGLPLSHPPILGIYELNPVYDTLSMLTMRTMGTFLYDCL
jgi:formiminoglutamase